MTAKIRMVVGLGNPGPKYSDTRHNIGRRLVETLQKRGTQSPGVELFTTQGYMNTSGEEVARVQAAKGYQPEEILVILDEFQIPRRQIKILKSGSDGGHNGLKSIIEHLGTQDIPRFRIGIGPYEGQDPAQFVLEKFDKQEMREFEAIFANLQDAVETSIGQGLDAAMNKFNGRILG